MATTETTPRCQSRDYCGIDQEIGIRVGGFHGPAQEFRLCVGHATDLYDLHDPARKGDRGVELFDL